MNLTPAENFTVIDVAEKLKKLANNPQNPITTELGVWVTRIVLERKKSDIRIEETPWDTSSYGVQTNEPFDLSDYSTVEDFLDNEATGNTVATYCSGSGLAAELYFSQFYELMTEVYTDYIVENFPDARDIESQSHVNWDIIEELYNVDINEWLFSKPLMEMPLSDCFEMFLDQAIYERNQENIRIANNQAEKAIQRAYLQSISEPALQHIKNLAGKTRWEKSNWDNLIKIIDEAIAKFNEESVAAALAFLSLNVSNSVSYALHNKYGVPRI